MEPQILYNCAHILLAAGIILLILSVILFFRFDVIGMIRSELAERNETSRSGSDSYYTRVASRIHSESSIEDNKVFEDMIADEQYAPEENDAPVEPLPELLPEADTHDAEISETVLISGSNNTPADGETIVTSRNRTMDPEEDDFMMIDNIIVIHGDPHAIK